MRPIETKDYRVSLLIDCPTSQSTSLLEALNVAMSNPNILLFNTMNQDQRNERLKKAFRLN